MLRSRRCFSATVPSLLVFALLSAGALWPQSNLKVLYQFGAPGDGYEPISGVIFGPDGNLYGTTYYGGTGCSLGCGTVFQLVPDGYGNWSENIILRLDEFDGGQPNSLVANSAGVLFGSTELWGAFGFGTVFQLVPGGDGSWHEAILHEFKGLWDGGTPAGVTLDQRGRLYGTTGFLDFTREGNVFTLSPQSLHIWYELVLHSFHGGQDNYTPNGGLTIGPDGSVYGTSFYGGLNDTGCVFKLRPQPGGAGWIESIIYEFKGQGYAAGQDGVNPFGGVVMDATGNLYGTTEWGGPPGYGAVYKLSPQSDGTWKETVLYSFQGGHDGGNPRSGVLLDTAGNLYGTTLGVQGAFNHGTVFELSPQAGGNWKETVLTEFQGTLQGYSPEGNLVMDAQGNLYGTTVFGGEYGGAGGVVFEVVLGPAAPANE